MSEEAWGGDNETDLCICGHTSAEHSVKEGWYADCDKCGCEEFVWDEPPASESASHDPASSK